ncbi:MAG: 4Fe-4S binding protein [Muribaculaceae bacterium]|nr:4Fe-4S binding protein [Muribaculaceae bacterium]
MPLHPRVDERKCNSCGACAALCPTGAINPQNPHSTDGTKCITCCRCIGTCPQDARSLGGLLYRVAGWKFVRDNSRRLEPEWFA